MTIKIKHKRGTASSITTANPTLAAGELAFETDTRRFKLGDGTTAWSSLSYVTPYVTATDRILGRSSAGAGSAEEITCTAAGRALLSGADAAAQRTTLSVQPTASPAFTGTATVTIDSASSVTNPLLMLNPSMANNAIQLVRMGKASATNESMSLEYKYVSSGTSVLGFGHFGDAFGTGFCQAKGGNVGIGTSSPGGKLEVAGGQLLVTAGSVSACGVAFSGDVNTGLAQIGGADTASLVTAGVERVRCTSGGTVEVRANSGSISHGLAYNENGGEIVLYDETQTAATLIDQISTDTRVLELVNGSNLKLGLGGSNTTGLVQFMRAGYQEAMRIDASGNVGIGISPSTLLHLNSLGVLRLQTGSVTMDCTPTAGATDSFVWNTSANAAYRWSMNGTERMRIESDGKLYAYNTYGTTVGATNRDLFIDSGGLIGYVSSIRASKTNIAAIEDVSWLRDLTPVSFHYRKRNEDGTYSDEADGTLDYGLIAEDVEPVAPEVCFYDVVDGEPQLRGVHYSKLITPMLRYIQQLEARIAALEERVNA